MTMTQVLNDRTTASWGRLGMVLALVFVFSAVVRAEDGASWRAGVAKVKVTPEGKMWMSGYGPRLAKSKLHDLWVRVLVLEAADGKQAVIITSDVCGFSKVSYDGICSALEKRCGLDRAAVRLTCSHTHTGPALRECLHVCWPWDDDEARRLVEKYSFDLEGKIVETVANALTKMAPVTLSAGEGTAEFAVNRRNNPEAEVTRLRESGNGLRGPVDHSVPVLAVRAADGELRAVVFGYACHCTTLSLTEWSGDFAGYAMLELERRYPQLQAMFYQGCGADQNPLPRKTVELCQKYGNELAAGVESALQKPMPTLTPRLKTAFEFAELEFKRPLTEEFLREQANQKSVQGQLAARHLQQLQAGQRLPTSHPYAVQVWKLGQEQLWISLSGEVVVDYSLTYKEKYGPQTWVNGFAHDLVCYVPSARILREGGGQEVGIPWSYGLPALEWADDIEERIHASVGRLVDQVK